MSKFNKKTQPKQKPVMVANKGGGVGFAQDRETELASLILTSFLSGNAHESESVQEQRLTDLLDSFGESTFPAKAAIFARNEFGMRSVSHLIAAEIGERIKGKEWTKSFFEKVIRRPDDITEILSRTISQVGTVPNAMKKGLAASFAKFDEYQLAKYRGEGKAVSLVDAVNLLHPKPVGKNKIALKKLIADTLRSVNTWESKISEAGKSEDVAEAKSEAWEDLIKTKKIAYLALVRNLRNILTSVKDVGVIQEACELLMNKEKCKNSLIFPFTFWSAYFEVDSMQLESVTKKLVMSALNKALEMSCDNIPVFEGRTLVAIDYSGSMGGTHITSTLSNRGVASLFATVLAKKNPASDIVIFGDDAKYVKNFNVDDSIFTNLKNLMMNNEGNGYYGSSRNTNSNLVHCGHSTNFHAAFTVAKEKYDRIVFFSDMQANSGFGEAGLRDYKKKFGNDPLIIAVDLAGNGSTQFRKGHIQIAGWSEKIFEFMKNDTNTLVKKIKAIEL